MDKQIIAIGGGGFGRNPGIGVIEKYILHQSDKDTPNICFIPTATGDSESYKVSYYTTMTQLDCNPTHLDLFKRTPNLEGLIHDQDIVFVGGGNTKSMLAVWRDWNLDIILKEAYESGVVMSGVSAGAICWFEKGITDSWSEDLNLLRCLGFVKGNCCPHYDEEPERKPALTNFISKSEIDDCFAIDGGCALHMKNNRVFQSVSFRDDKDSFIVQKENEIIKEKVIPKVSI